MSYKETAERVFRIIANEGWLHPDPTLSFDSALALATELGENLFPAFFLESVYTALSHTDPMIVLRATFQAYSYAAQISYGKCPLPSLTHKSDLLMDCRNRCEEMISPFRSKIRSRLIEMKG